MARAHGSYPWCRWFKSSSRYYTEESTEVGFFLHAQLPDIFIFFAESVRNQSCNLNDLFSERLCHYLIGEDCCATVIQGNFP